LGYIESQVILTQVLYIGKKSNLLYFSATILTRKWFNLNGVIWLMLQNNILDS